MTHEHKLSGANPQDLQPGDKVRLTGANWSGIRIQGATVTITRLDSDGHARFDARGETDWTADEGVGWGVERVDADSEPETGGVMAELIAECHKADNAMKKWVWIPVRYIREVEDILEKVTAERDAYKRAKEENDERFMLERDIAREERDAAYAVIEQAPHDPWDCEMYEVDPDGVVDEVPGEPCTCWKSAAPADALREVKAQAWDEGHLRGDVDSYHGYAYGRSPNPYREGADRG